MRTAEEIVSGLCKVGCKSTSPLVQSKTAKALANMRRARTLIEKAEQTLLWAEYYERTHQVA